MDPINNEQFSDSLWDLRARFAFCDLHIHSPASFDVLSSHREQLSPEAQVALKNLTAPDRQSAEAVRKYQEEVFERYPADRLLDEVVAQRDRVSTELNLSSSDDWAIAAITDHNVCKYSCRAAELAWDRRGENRLVLLPAVELDVRFPVPGGDESVAHILCIFPVHTQPDDIAHAITTAGNGRQWKEGQPEYELEELAEFVDQLRTSAEHPAICIAAHVSSAKGLHKECKNAIRLSGKEAEIAQLQSTFDAIYADSGSESEEFRKAKSELEVAKKNYAEELQLATLAIIGSCGFDALQVRSPNDYKHYRRLHRHSQSKGRATLIVCSDAHCVSDVFRAGDHIPHLKLSHVLSHTTDIEAFELIRTSLRFAETRFTARPFSRSESWIEGVFIRRDSADAHTFFRTPTNGIIGLSRNLTCIVGGRGSGKSALLDAIGFVSRPNDFSPRALHERKGNERPDYIGRSEKLFLGHEIRLCWRFARSDLPAEFRKGAFASRYFSDAVKSGVPSQTELSGKSAESVQLPEVTIYRFQELEEHATGPKLREFLDSVHSWELNNKAAEIADTISKLKANRAELVEVAKKIFALTESGTPLRVYAENLYLFRQVDSTDMKEQLQRMDDAKAAKDIIQRAKESFQEINAKFGEADFIAQIDGIKFESLSVDQSIGERTDELRMLESELSSTDAQASRFAKLRSDIAAVKEALSQSISRAGELLEAATERHTRIHDELVEQGMPTGVEERNARRLRLQESKTQLADYREKWRRFNELRTERNNLFDKLERAGMERTALRRTTCQQINSQLIENLDESVLKLSTHPGDGSDNNAFISWLDESFESALRTHRSGRVQEIANKGIMPRHVRDILFHPDEEKARQFIVEKERVSEGRVSKEDVGIWLQNRAPLQILDPEPRVSQFEHDDSDMPAEIRNGLCTFSGQNDEQAGTILDHALQLEEIEFDDQPVVYMNDRPGEPGSALRPLDEMSPGQRCSALLPILILSGTGPLIIDQPEDNLDNRLIREVIVNVLSTMKLRRQIIIATHNPNLPVLGDAEQVIALAATGEMDAQLVVHGDLDDPGVVKAITDIMEGGREAFQYRYAVYGAHWGDSVVADGA